MSDLYLPIMIFLINLIIICFIILHHVQKKIDDNRRKDEYKKWNKEYKERIEEEIRLGIYKPENIAYGYSPLRYIK